MLAVIVLFVGWAFFVFAVINIVAVGIRYAFRKPDVWGVRAFLKMLRFSLALTVWYYLVFGLFPYLQILQNVKSL